MNSIVKFFAKKYLLGVLNDGLKAAQEKADVRRYVQKIAQIIQFLSVLVESLKDNQIDKEECEKIISDFNGLFTEKGE